MKTVFRLATCACWLAATMVTTGCTFTDIHRFGANRFYDFRDTFAIGVGVTAANPVSGNFPPSLGAYVEITDFFHLGAISHNGYTAELDLRGTFVGPEYRRRLGFLGWQSVQIRQDYQNALYANVFKDQTFPWSQRMAQWGYRHGGHPAKRLAYDYWAVNRQEGRGLRPRGWQYWEYAGAEFALSDPFITHFGLMLRFGFDISEVSDLALGLFTLGWLDYKGDDLNTEEFLLRRRKALVPEPMEIEAVGDPPPERP